MYFSNAILATSLLAVCAMAGPLAVRDNDQGLKPICQHLKTENKGCVRYTKGFDVTGVVTEVDLQFPTVKDECDCIQECLNRPTTCATYVYKFSTPASVQSGHRTCTLYSQFNLPSAVTVQYDLNNTNNMNINAPEIIMMGNNPQHGAVIAQTFKDINLNTTADNDAVSGPVWTLADGKVQC